MHLLVYMMTIGTITNNIKYVFWRVLVRITAWTLTMLTGDCCGFAQSPQASSMAVTMLLSRLFPCTSFPVYHSQIIPQLDALLAHPLISASEPLIRNSCAHTKEASSDTILCALDMVNVLNYALLYEKYRMK